MLGYCYLPRKIIGLSYAFTKSASFIAFAIWIFALAFSKGGKSIANLRIVLWQIRKLNQYIEMFPMDVRG